MKEEGVSEPKEGGRAQAGGAYGRYSASPERGRPRSRMGLSGGTRAVRAHGGSRRDGGGLGLAWAVLGKAVA